MKKENLNITDIWTGTLDNIRETIKGNEYNAWFSRLHFKSFENNQLTLIVPSAFFKEGFEKKYLSLTEKTFSALSGIPCRINLEITADNGKKPHSAEAAEKQENQEPAEKPGSAQKKESAQAVSKDKKNDCLLNPAYTFDSFVPGDNSNLAYNAALAIAKNPGGTVYNPCLLYGGVGLGKTHLLQSIGNYIQRNSDLKVIYVTSENFTNDFIQSLQTKTQNQFQKKYRKVSVLLMDDIQFLESKSGVQTELFNTFNDLYDSGRQIVFTSDRPVEEIKGISSRLQSRFVRGLVIDIQPPEYETRLAILQTKCKEKKFTIRPDVLEYIAKNVSSNVRVLESCITKLIAYSQLLNREISLETAKDQLKQIINSNNDISGISLEFIIRTVANYYNVSPYDIKGKNKGKSIIIPRQIAMYLCRKLTNYSTKEIAAEFGGKQHTTVIHNVQKTEEKIKAGTDDTKTVITKLSNLIKQETRNF